MKRRLKPFKARSTRAATHTLVKCFLGLREESEMTVGMPL